MTRPVYPDNAFRKQVRGTVVVDALLSASGQVIYARVRRSIPELNHAALDCVKQWTFEPALRQGSPVPSVITAPVAFEIYGGDHRPIGP